MVLNRGSKKKKEKICKIVVFLSCSAGAPNTLGPIVAYGCFDETVCTAPLGPIGTFQ